MISRRSALRWTPLLCLTFCVSTTAVRSDETLVLSFGVYTSDKPTVMYAKFKPVLSFLEQTARSELNKNVKIKLRIFKSYDAALDALVDGKVDFVRFGPASYVLAKQRSKDVSLLAVEEIDGDNPRRFNGVVLTQKNNSIEKLEDLKGKSFAFGDENSTIGRYLVQAELVEHGVFAKDLSRFEYLGRHDLVVTAVLHGRFDAGAAKEGTFRKYADKGLKIVHPFENVTKPWVARGGLSPSVSKSLSNALLSLKDRKILSRIGKKLVGFGTVKDADYEFVRNGMEQSEEFLGKVAAEGRTPGDESSPVGDTTTTLNQEAD